MDLTDSRGGSVGFLGAGVGTSYGVSLTDVDIVDINGDGLPDHVTSDPATGNVRVKLSFGGRRFSNEIVWTGHRWQNRLLNGAGGLT